MRSSICPKFRTASTPVRKLILLSGFLHFHATSTAFCVKWTDTLFHLNTKGFGAILDFFYVTVSSGWVVQYLNKVGHSTRIRYNDSAREDNFNV